MKTASFSPQTVPILGVLFLLVACSSAPTNKGEVAGAPFEARHLIQSDFNRVASLGMKNNLASLQLLMDKLYKRNPKEWRKTASSIEEAKALVWKVVLERKAWMPLAEKKTRRHSPTPWIRNLKATVWPPSW